MLQSYADSLVWLQIVRRSYTAKLINSIHITKLLDFECTLFDVTHSMVKCKSVGQLSAFPSPLVAMCVEISQFVHVSDKAQLEHTIEYIWEMYL